jgi:hypothetical protein
MELFGKQLANQVPDTTTGNQARAMFGAMADSLSNAYATLNSYQWDSRLQAMVLTAAATVAAPIYGLTPDTVAPAKEYLDSTNTMIQGYYANTFEDDATLTTDLLQQLRTSVSATSAAVKTVDDLYSTSWASELADNIVEAAGTVSAKIANAVAKVAGSFLGGMWWLIAIVIIVLVVWHKWGRKVMP